MNKFLLAVANSNQADHWRARAATSEFMPVAGSRSVLSANRGEGAPRKDNLA